jgi:serine/threonine-protein kinase
LASVASVPTQALPPVEAGSMASTPAAVLYDNELMRGRMWVATSVAIGLGGLVCAALIEAPGTLARQLLAAGSGATLLISLIGLWVLRGDAAYSPRLAALYTYSCLIAILPAFHFFGWFSAVTILLALGGLVYAMGHSVRAVCTMAAASMIAHAAIAGLTIAGKLPDRGVATIRVSGTIGQLLCLGMCQFLFGLTFLLGRLLRGQMLGSVERYGRVIEENARRDALLQEADEEVQRARKIGAPGRYTGLQLGGYKLGVVLGRGGMGEVYEAAHIVSSEAAAVKVLSTSSVLDERAIRRFEREIDLAAAVVSPHIVRVLRHSSPGDSVLYLAMERLEGAVLADELRTVQRPPIEDMLVMLRHVGEGLAAAHAAGVVHRDLTPRNIFHHRDVWKILDFGVSKLMGSEQTLTGNAVIGTMGYMSPEQAAGKEANPRSDLFGLGCVAYRCLTGMPPFQGRALAEVIYKIVNSMPLRPSLAAPLPAPVDLVLAIALAKEPDYRFESAMELVRALEDACHGKIEAGLERRGEALAALMPWRDEEKA